MGMFKRVLSSVRTRVSTRLKNRRIKRFRKYILELPEFKELFDAREGYKALGITSEEIQTRCDRLTERINLNDRTNASLIRSQRMLDELIEDFKRTKLSLTFRTERLAESVFQLSENGSLREYTDFWNEGEFIMLDKHTYSQAGEDSIVAHLTAVLGIPFEKCSYLDLGANQPKEMSNTYFFYSRGAKGVLVEANPKLAARLRAVRSRDTVLERCVGARSGEMLPFNILNIDGLSAVGDVSAVLAENPEAHIVETVDIETISVSDIFREYFPSSAPVILNIDLEGLEMTVLKDIDFVSVRPTVIIIEMIPYTVGLTVAQKNKEVSDFMASVGYEEFAFTGINSVFLDSRSEIVTAAKARGGNKKQ